MVWQRYRQDTPELGYGRIVRGGRVTGPPPEVPAERQHRKAIAAYRLQFTVPADQKDLHVKVFHNDLSPTPTSALTPPMEARTPSRPRPVGDRPLRHRTGSVRIRGPHARYGPRRHRGGVGLARAAM